MLGVILIVLLLLGLFGALYTDEGFFWFLIILIEVMDD